MKNITTNSKNLFYFINHNIAITNFNAEDIYCIGDERDTSLIIFDSGGNQKKELFMKNFNVKNSLSNGPLIKIEGNFSEIYGDNINIDNVKVYGSIIECISYKVM